ncbi:peptidase, S54 family [Capnocytophaga ochracea F0287]|uniref:Peptidase, S54 family n=1 Tax=Capnocytophaga ochracea F0287 TaxID=873517 RepID=E4MR15_CAPOC|nr:rhomboid family intramembrane serine protease [Capnocytophaga ochracea]EFS97913.1 peptidase, S54 family [Capnocytophaga ochracea F0287]EJF45864.1 peptidase, S54 family [Capnocytophaga ochracea str. Holt 25]UEB43824.1 rhomboid family intramembrane serine protease [Capnocytophaga ochracea]
MDRISKTVLHLIIINTIVLILTVLNEKGLFLPQVNIVGSFALHHFETPFFHWWQYISYMFMHADFTHLLFNMYALWAFGTPLENIWGRNKFLFFYFSCGVGAALLHTGVNYYYVHQAVNALAEAGVPANEVLEMIAEGKYNPNWSNIINHSTFQSMYDVLRSTTVGASGAIYGILVAFGMFFPDAKLMLFFIPYPIAARYFIPLLVALDLIMGFVGGITIFGGNIAHFAHVGGALIGFLIMLYWKKHNFDKNRWDRRL